MQELYSFLHHRLSYRAYFMQALFFLLCLCPLAGWGQATLPTSHNGPWTSGLPTGWTQTGLGSDYATNLGTNSTGGSAKFDNIGDVLLINVDGAIGSLTYYIKGNPASGSATSGTFLVEESVDGSNFTTLRTITNQSTTTANYTETPNSASRFIRFNYSARSSGNIQLDQVALTATAGTPTLTPSPTSITGFTYVAGSTTSPSKTFSLTGSNLTANAAITVTGSTNYEVSLDNTNFGATASIPNTAGGTLVATTVYVRLKTGLSAGTYNSETIAIEGGGITSAKTVTVSGSVSAAPLLTVNPGSLSGFNTIQGTASASQSYLLKGTNLTASIMVTAPDGYAVAQSATSTTTPGSFSATQTVSAGNANAGRSIYVRLTATAAAGTYGTAAAPFLVSNASAEVATQNVAVDGIVSAQTPAISASPNNLTGFSTQVGSASGIQSYVLTPTGLSGPITVTAPTGYAVSLTAGGTFASSVEASATGSSTVYVRLTGAAIGAINGIITNVSGSASQDVTVSGEVTPLPIAGQVVISQVYGGGGNSNAPFNADFIELHNVTGSPVTISGWSVQYTSGAGSAWSTQSIPASTTLAAGAYYLIRTSSPGSTGSALPTPDLTTSFSMSNNAGKVALIGNSTALTSSCPTSGVLDFVGYGASTNCSEGSGPTVDLSNTTAALRQNGGCLDTDDNARDFLVTAPNPRNTASAVNICAPQPEINVMQAGSNLAVGSTVTFNNTPAGSTVSIILDIQNRGTAVLNLTGTPIVAVSGVNAADFAITQPMSATVAPGGTTQFTVEFTPVAQGNRAATLSIANDDADENPYILQLRGFATASLASTATGRLLLEETFNYPAGDDLKAHGWSAHSTGTNPVAVVTGNNALAGYPLALADTTATRRVKLVPSGDDLNKAFSIPVGTSTLYAATTLRVSAAGTSDYFLHFYDPNNAQTLTFRGRVFVRAATGGYQLGISVTGSTPIVYANQVFNLNSIYLLVLKYEVVSSGDIVTLYALPSVPATEPSTPLITVTGSDSYSTLGALALRQGGSNSSTLTLDGVRVATGWGSAIGQLIISSPAATIAAGSYYSLNLQNNDVLTSTGAVTLEGPLTLVSGIITTTAANSLTLLPTSTIGNGSGADSYVNGPLKRIIAPTVSPTTFVFPIGKEGKYRPAALSVATQASTTTYTAELINQSARSSAVTAPLTRVSGLRYISITPDVQPTGFSGTVTLSFAADDQVTDPAATSLVIAKRSNSEAPWESIGRSNSSGGAAAGSITSSTFTSFSDFALASTDASQTVNPLPVTLVAFDAVAAYPHVRLFWRTAVEQNNAGFEVQRSLDAKQFQTIGKVEGRGTTTQGQQYAFLDAYVPAGTLYYRLRQLDTDGKSSYSTVRAVSRSTEISLYPNPVHNELTLQLPATITGAYQVLNSLGQVVLQGNAQGATSVQVAKLPAGVYQVLVTTPTGRSVYKFIKE